MIEYGDGDDLPADLRERLARAVHLSEDELVELLCADQVERWRGGEHIPAEAYLALHPKLSTAGEGAFELIYGEYLVRELLGESPKLDEFLRRFPRFADRLRRQISLHQSLAVEDASVVDDQRDVSIPKEMP